MLGIEAIATILSWLRGPGALELAYTIGEICDG